MTQLIPAKPTSTSIPIACLLPDETAVERRDEVRTAVFKHIQATRELANGYAFQFPGSDEWAVQLIAFINSERQCCPFLRFELHFELEQGPIWLIVRGEDGVKAFVRSELALLNET